MSLSPAAADLARVYTCAIRLIAGFSCQARGMSRSDVVAAWLTFLEAQDGVRTYLDLVEDFAASPAYLEIERKIQETLQGVRR